MSGTCCLQGYSTDEIPKGKIEKVHGVDTYIAKGTSTENGVIVVIPDVFGMPAVINKVLADNLAAKGFLVYVPSLYWFPPPLSIAQLFHNIDEKPLSIFRKAYLFSIGVPSIIAFLSSNSRSSVVGRTNAFLKAVHDDGHTKVYATGYCFGAPFVLDALKKGLIKAGFCAHPSRVSMEEWAGVAPMSIAVGDKDMVMKEEQVKQVQELYSKQPNCEIEVYPEMFHGFACRGNMKDKEQYDAITKARDQATNFFKAHV